MPPIDAHFKTIAGLRLGVALNRDAVDSSSSENFPGADCLDGPRLICYLLDDLTRTALLSDEQLQVVGSLSDFPSEIPSSLAVRVSEMCDRLYLDKCETREALATIAALKRRLGTDEPDAKSTTERSTQTDEDSHRDSEAAGSKRKGSVEEPKPTEKSSRID